MPMWVPAVAVVFVGLLIFLALVCFVGKKRKNERCAAIAAQREDANPNVDATAPPMEDRVIDVSSGGVFSAPVLSESEFIPVATVITCIQQKPVTTLSNH